MKEEGWEGGDLILSFSSITEQCLLWEYCHNFSGFSKTAKLHCCICCQLCLSSLDELVQLTIIKSGKAQNSLRAAVPSRPLHRGGGGYGYTYAKCWSSFFFFSCFFPFLQKAKGGGGGEDSKTLNQNLANCSPFLKFVMLTWNFYSSIAKALSLKCFQIVPTNTKSVTSQLVDIRSSEFTGWTMRARLLSQLFHNWDSKRNRLVGMKV